MASERHMKVVRTLIIEGPEGWVKNTLKRCYVKPGPDGQVTFPGGASLSEETREIEIVERTTYLDSGLSVDDLHHRGSDNMFERD